MAVEREAPRDERSLGQLVGDLSRQLGTLVHKEIELARTEVTAKATEAGRDAAMVGAGGALLYAALLGVMAAVVFLLAEQGVDPWMAALVVAAIVGATGGFLVWRGRTNLAQARLAPEATIETLKDDAQWAKEQVK
ncbi:MAG TPA: phage holin family protein [Candidatus Limnocylindrales bacterium]|jgi:hypothetical protein